MREAGGIDSQLEFALDYDFFVRLMAVGRFERLDEFIGAFRVHAQSKTSTVLATTGKTEIELIRQRYAVRKYPWDRLLGGALRRLIERRSRAVFAHEKPALSAALQQLTER